jgi:hypothetical protein
MKKAVLGLVCVLALSLSLSAADQTGPTQYKLLATSRTSTLEKELNDAAAQGYRLEGTMGGEIRGGEVITVMARVKGGAKYHYRLLATSRTGTMEKELQEAASEGYDYAGYTARGEVIVILERDTSKPARKNYDYKLLATSRTSTMQKELDDAVEAGYEFVAVIRRGEVITFLRKKVEA